MATLQTLLSQQMVERLGWTLIHFVWQAAMVALLLAVVLRGLRRSSSNVRYIVACLAMVLIVALPLMTMSLVEVSRPVAEAGPILDGPPVMRTTPVEVVELPLEPFDAPVPEMPERVTRMSWTRRIATTLEPALPWLVLGWLLGVFGLSAWHLGGWAQLQRMKRRLVSEVAAPLHARLAALAERLGIRRAIGLWTSPLIEVPTVVGWVQPVILLPVGAVTGLSIEQLEAILAHELAHVRRCDYLVNLIQTVVEILGFYHPAVWWISHRVRDERENCCDDLAVQVCGDSRRYARALTCLEELRHVARTSRPRVTQERARARCPRHTAVAASGGSLVARIARLLGRPAVDHRRFAWLPGLIALLVVAAILIPTAFVLAAPEASPAAKPGDSAQASEPPVIEATTQTRAGGESQDQTPIRINYLLFIKAMPDKVVDRETRLLVGEILATEIPQAPDEIAAKQNATLVEILRTWVVDRLLMPETIGLLVAVLQSRGYLDGEATPEVLASNDQQAHINVISEELTLPTADPTSSWKPIELGTFIQVTPHISSPTSEHITLDIGVEWKDRVEEAHVEGTPTVRSTEIASTVTTLRNRYVTLLAEADHQGDAEAATAKFHLVMLRADLFEPSLTYGTTAAVPAPADKSLSRQVILDIQTVSVEEGSLGDGIVEWSRPQTSGWPSGIQMGYTPDKTSTDALQMHLADLYAQGAARRLAQQRLTTQDGCEARFKAVKEEWFSLAAAPAGNAADPGPEHASIASGTIITATPTIGEANSITLDLNIEFSESLPKSEGADLPTVTRRTSRNVVTVRDGGTALLAGLSCPYPDPTAEITILVTATLAPEAEPFVQQNPSRPQTPPPSEAPAIHTPVLSPPRVATVEPSADATDRQVLLSFTIAEVVTEEALDRATARQLRALLTDASHDAKFNLPSVEELQKPVQYIVSKYANICNQTDDAARAFTDLLVSRGHATVYGSPEMLIRLGASGHLSCDNIPVMGAPAPPSQTDNPALSLEVTPTTPHDANGIRLTLALRARNLASLDSKGRLSATAANASFNFTLSARNNQYVMLPLITAVGFEGDDLDAKTATTLLLVKPTLIEPPATPALPASEQATHDAAREFEFVRADPTVRDLMQRIAQIEVELIEARQKSLPQHPEIVQRKQLLEALHRRVEARGRELHQELDDDLATRLPSVRVSTKTPDERASSLDEKPRVMLDIELVKFLTDQPLSPEAATQLSGLWDQMYAKREAGREQRGSLPRAGELQILPRALLERCTENAQGDSEALEILVDLLASREYLKVAMNPTVEVCDGQQAQVMSKQHVPNPTAHPGAPETVECRDLVTVTPRVDSAGHITLDLAAEICDVILDDSKTPRISKHSIDTKAVVDKNKTFVCRLESATEGLTQDNGILYLLAHPRVVRSAPSASVAIPTAESEPSGLGTVTATFEGTDLRQVLKSVAEMAGANIMYDANLSGEVYATLDDVSTETALRIILAGSPYVVRKTPDGYAITTRDVQPPTSPSRKVDAVAVEARLLLVDPECLEALRRGLPIQGVTAPADVNALHALGDDLAKGRTPLLEPGRVQLLLRAAQQYTASKTLAAPKVTVLDAESATLSLSNHMCYTSGYREPNDGSPEPIPQHASKEIGMRLSATPHLIEDQNNIRLQFEMEINSLLGMQKALYRGKYEYDVPTFTAVTTATEIVIPDGQTALIHVGETPAVGNILSDESEPRGRMLLLIKPSRTTAEPPDPAPPMQPGRRPGDPGMGGFRPGDAPSLSPR